MSDDRFPVSSSQPPSGAGLTDNPAAAPGGVGQGAPPAAAIGALPRTGQPGFALQHAPGLGPQQLAPPGMMINPDFVRWRQMAAAWQQEKNRRQMQFMSACNVIRRDAATGFAIDIEADSTVAADEQAEKQARTEFLTSIMPLLQVIVPQLQSNPAMAPLAKALVLFGVRAFPAARALEENFEQAFTQLAQAPPPPQPPKGNVKTPQEIQSEMAIAQGDQRVDMAKLQADAQKTAAQVQVQQQKTAADMFRASVELQQEQQKMQADNTFRTAELAQAGQVQDMRSQVANARLAMMLSRSTAGLV